MMEKVVKVDVLSELIYLYLEGQVLLEKNHHSIYWGYRYISNTVSLINTKL